MLGKILVALDGSRAFRAQMIPLLLVGVLLPIGVALVATGIVYFVLAGRFVLPKTASESSTTVPSWPLVTGRPTAFSISVSRMRVALW